MEKKICVKCGIEKNITEFPKDKGIEGKIYYRNKCKTCKSAEIMEYRAKKKGIEYKPKKITEKNTSTGIIKAEYKIDNMLSKEDIKTLKDMINTHNNFKNINFSFSKGDRTPKTYNLDYTLAEKIHNLAKQKDITDSDMINIIVKYFFDGSS